MTWKTCSYTIILTYSIFFYFFISNFSGSTEHRYFSNLQFYNGPACSLFMLDNNDLFFPTFIPNSLFTFLCMTDRLTKASEQFYPYL